MEGLQSPQEAGRSKGAHSGDTSLVRVRPWPLGDGAVTEVPQARASQRETAHWDADQTLGEATHGRQSWAGCG